MASKDVHLRKLSEDTGISVSDLKKILDGTYEPQRPYFLSNRPVTIFDQLQQTTKKSQPVVTHQTNHYQVHQEHEEASGTTILQEIAETDDPEELYGILEQLDYTDGEFIIAYEKLVRIIAQKITTTNDLDDLEELNKYTPDGSAEEVAIFAKIRTLEQRIINETKDFDDLVSLYQNDTYTKESMQYLAQRLINACTSPSQTHKLINDVFPEDSLEYYLVETKHQELVQRAINSIRSLNDVNDLDDFIGADEDANVYLAQQIVQLCGRDPEKIWEHHDSFNDGSEAQEVLAQGAINQCNTYTDTVVDVLDSIQESFSSDSRIGRMAAKREQTLLAQYLQNTTDVSELENHLENLEFGDPLKKQVTERIVNLTKTKDDLHNLVDTDTYIGNLAQTKLSQLLKEEQSRARSAKELSGFEDYVESPSTEEDLLDLRLVELFTNEAEARDYRIRDASFAMYRLAKRFGPKVTQTTPAVVQPVVIAPPVVTEETPAIDPAEEERLFNQQMNELRLKDTEMKRKISRLTTSLSALNFMQTCPVESEYTVLAYKKASELLTAEMLNTKTKEELKPVLDAFPRRSSEWAAILKKMGTFYPKPWYMFWS